MSESTTYFDAGERLVQWKLNEALYRLVNESSKDCSSTCIICIGTDRSTGDSYGPLTGHMLSRIDFCRFDLYGTFRNPVHALTLPGTLERIDLVHSLVIAIDASVGSPEFVGHIGIGTEPIRPGSGLGKKLPPVGDISITGIAAQGGPAPFMMLQNAPLGMIYNMAEKTFIALQTLLYRLLLEKRIPAQNRAQAIRTVHA